MPDRGTIDGVIQMLRAHRCVIERLEPETLMDQLEMDSIHLAGFMIDLEEQYRILVPDEEFKRWIKVGDIAEYIEKYTEEYGGGDLSEM